MRTNALHTESVKGTGFSPYVKVDKSEGALAPEILGASGLAFETWESAIPDRTVPWCAP